MTSLLNFFAPMRRPAAFAAAAMLAAIVGGTTLRVDPTLASTASVNIPSSAAASLVAATSGQELVHNRATGDQAKLINASMPFSTAPIAASRPFDLSTSDPLDRRRALLCMTQAIYYEAGYESVEGRRAVAQVVLNRMRHPAFPKSICGVVYQGQMNPGCQFSFACDGKTDNPRNDWQWAQAKDIAKRITAGELWLPDVGYSTYYHANYVSPKWIGDMNKIDKIGRHIFYKKRNETPYVVEASTESPAAPEAMTDSSVTTETIRSMEAVATTPFGAAQEMTDWLVPLAMTTLMVAMEPTGLTAGAATMSKQATAVQTSS